MPQNSPAKPKQFFNLSVHYSHGGSASTKSMDVHVHTYGVLLIDPQAQNSPLAAISIDDTIMHHRGGRGFTVTLYV